MQAFGLMRVIRFHTNRFQAPGQFLSTTLDDMQIQPIDSVSGAIVRITEKQLTKRHTVFSTDH